MATLPALALSAVLLAALPEDDTPMDLTHAEAFTIAANVVGAATACDRIAHGRVSAMARQIAAVATARAVSIEDVTSIDRLLMVSAVAGRQAVEGDQLDCETVETAFGKLEQIVLQTPV